MWRWMRPALEDANFIWAVAVIALLNKRRVIAVETASPYRLSLTSCLGMLIPHNSRLDLLYRGTVLESLRKALYR